MRAPAPHRIGQARMQLDDRRSLRRGEHAASAHAGGLQQLGCQQRRVGQAQAELRAKHLRITGATQASQTSAFIRKLTKEPHM